MFGLDEAFAFEGTSKTTEPMMELLNARHENGESHHFKVGLGDRLLWITQGQKQESQALHRRWASASVILSVVYKSSPSYN